MFLLFLTIFPFISVLINLDTTEPTIIISSVTKDIYDGNNVYSVTFGNSGGSVSCINKSRNNASVTTYASIEVLGINTIECSAISGAGKSTTVTGNVTINASLSAGDSKLNVIRGGYKSNGYIILPKYQSTFATQYGPYIQTNSGCYIVMYSGNNLNASPANAYAKDQHANGTDKYQAVGMDYITTGLNYYLIIDKSTTRGLEVLYNNFDNSIDVSISNIRIENRPESVCYIENRGTKCADENGICSYNGSGFTSTSLFCYGFESQYKCIKANSSTESVSCTNATFGDPASGKKKACYLTRGT